MFHSKAWPSTYVLHYKKHHMGITRADSRLLPIVYVSHKYCYDNIPTKKYLFTCLVADMICPIVFDQGGKNRWQAEW